MFVVEPNFQSGNFYHKLAAVVVVVVWWSSVVVPNCLGLSPFFVMT